MELTGTIFKIGDTIKVTDSFSKRVIILETDEKFTNYVPIEFPNDKALWLDVHQNNEKVKVSVNIRGNLSKAADKAYISFQAWKIEAV